jgi:hypothetical protein
MGMTVHAGRWPFGMAAFLLFLSGTALAQISAFSGVAEQLTREQRRLVLDVMRDRQDHEKRAVASLEASIEQAKRDQINHLETKSTVIARREASLAEAMKRFTVAETAKLVIEKKPIAAPLAAVAPWVIESIYSITNPALPLCGKSLLYRGDSNQITWNATLDGFLDRFGASLPAVGRIEVDQVAYRPGASGPEEYLHRVPIGTGFVVDSKAVVTAGHVASYFWDFQAKQLRTGVVAVRFNPGAEHEYQCDTATSAPARKLGAVVNSRYDHTRPPDERQIDFAVISLSGDEEPFPQVLPIAHAPLAISSRVVVVAYPSEDPRVEEQAWSTIMNVPVEGGMYPVPNIKRIAPGRIQPACANGRAIHVPHNASTMNKSSGAPIISVDSGEVVGIQVAGFRDWGDGKSHCNLGLRSDSPDVSLKAD